MNEQIFQQQKLDLNLNFDLIEQKNKEQNAISTVNTYSKGNSNNNNNNIKNSNLNNINLDTKKKMNFYHLKKKKNMKKL
jgi:hypothetical protein